ncbi:MAG: biopolymer transporter ExbD [Verrucomicrobiales bacterium]
MPRRAKSVEEVSFQITPMIDMTFLLLIFFMVTTKLTEADSSVPVELPIARSALAPDDRIPRDVISIDAAGDYHVGESRHSEESLKAYLKQRFEKFPPLQIYLRADKATPAKRIRQFMEMAAEAGALDVIFGTYQEE